MSSSALLAGLCLVLALSAQENGGAPGKPAPSTKTPAKSAAAPADAEQRKIGASAQRNENVAVYQIDNNALKEANIRLGDNVTVVQEPPVEVGQYATEHGQAAGEPVVLKSNPSLPEWHGELFWWHQNSVFNARTFFQAGQVQPSHRNSFGGRYTSRLWKLGGFTLSASQTKIRGMVNGNVLVPLLSERTPRATDPATRALVEKFLAAFPAVAPNRPDFDPRALNTNSPQRIDGVRGDARLDKDAGPKAKVFLFHSLSRQRVGAFQFVAGQNPNTDIHSHRSRLTYWRAISPATELSLGFAFNRVKSVLLPEPNAVGPRVRFGFQIQELGPESQFPIDRAQNTFRWGALLRRQTAGGRHQLTVGGDISRFQLNGIETNNQRGYYHFSNNFGRTAIENLLYGTPSSYELTIGDVARGYRNISSSLFIADRWRVHPHLQIYYGLRYALETAPVEVNALDQILYRCDCNNFSPRLSLAYQGPAGWVARASYTVSFAQIPPVTYQQIRNNPPHARNVLVQNPDLVDPLRGINLDDSQGRYSPIFLSPDLVSPYVHQYNFTLEKMIVERSMLRLGYVGSRTIKTINAFITNRAEPVADLSQIRIDTVDQRRPDPRYYDVNYVVNGGIAYMDAARVSLDMRLARGLAWGATYTFGKALDTGSDYAATAANNDLTSGRHQWQYDSYHDRKALSTFDSTHAMQVHYSYDFPLVSDPQHWLARLVNGWQVSGATLLKTGTPLTLYVGSDAPGFGNVDGGPSDRPNILDPSILGATVSDPNTSMQIISRDRFAYIAVGGVRGNLGKGTFRKQGMANFNAALTKQWRWSGAREWTAMIRAEAYNLTNHAQFDEPQRNLTSPSFGRITNTLNDGRVLQFSLRFIL